MNARTRDALKELCINIDYMAQGTVQIIGIETATEVVQAAQNLFTALDKDETIVGD